MKIREAKIENLKEFIKLEKEFLKYNEGLKIDRDYKIKSLREIKDTDYKKEFKHRLSKKNSFFCFAKENGEFIGYIYGYIQSLPSLFKLRKVGYLDSIIVSKKYRKKNFASMLKNEFFSWLEKKKIKLCQINVASINKNTIKVYDKWGFKIDQYRLIKKLK
jgi:ribosomal protein S18 acetylase RimI-like enzyme